MKFENAYLTATSYVLPSTILPTSAVEEKLAPLYARLGLRVGRLEELTGIRERRVWPTTTLPSDIAAEAAENLFKKTGFDRKGIDLLIHGGVCRDCLEPATAVVVHAKLGLDRHCMAFDISNACVGVLNAVSVASAMIESGQIRSALLVTGENAGPVYESAYLDLNQAGKTEDDFRLALASLTLGSAGTALLLQHRDDVVGEAHKILGGVSQSDSEAWQLCVGTGDFRQLSISMRTQTGEMMRRGLVLLQVTWQMMKAKLGWEDNTPDHFVTHQISSAHQKKFFDLLKLNMEKAYVELDWLGNTGSAAAPLSLALCEERGKLKTGDIVAMLGIGSGLSTAMLGLKW